MRRFAWPALVLLAGFFGLGVGVVWGRRPPAPPEAPILTKVTSLEVLRKHSRELRKEVVQVTPSVHVAVGYGLANSILVEGPEGAVVIDVQASQEEGAEVAQAFAAITDKPLRAIVYTHNHTDHIFGAQAFIDRLARKGEPVEVFAHESTNALIDRLVSYYSPIITRRSLRMFGTFLDQEGVVNAGIGPQLGLRADSHLGVVRPTRTVHDRLEVQVAGLDLVLVHAPGETPDQLYVWFPAERVLAPGDNLYRSFPNLYTIRGTPYRDPLDWVASLDGMRALHPEHLVPSHTRPLSGREHIQQTLRDYRDGIQYVHDQTVRWINRGLEPDEIVARVRLPERLAASPYLKELYGTVEWSVRSVFAGNLGWFGGNPSQLQPLAPKARAERLATLVGGSDALRVATRDALDRGDYQWALELTDALRALTPEDSEVAKLRVAALTSLGARSSNPNARHYFLTSAAESAGRLQVPPRFGVPTDAMLKSLPVERFIRALTVYFDPAKAEAQEIAFAFDFPDLVQGYTLRLRGGIVEVQPGVREDAAVVARVDSLRFKQVLAGRRDSLAGLVQSLEVTRGSSVELARLLLKFDRPEAAPRRAP